MLDNALEQCAEHNEKLTKMEEGIVQSQECQKMFLDDLELSDNDGGESEFEQESIDTLGETRTIDSLDNLQGNLQVPQEGAY